MLFEAGDPDRPLVTGAVYNGTHPPAFKLPTDKTRSGIRTQSTPGGSGYNELSFQDAAGREQVYLQAQRDYDELVKANHTSTVGGAAKVAITGPKTESVGENVRLDVGGQRLTQIAKDDKHTVAGRLDVEVDGDHGVEVKGDVKTMVGCGSTLEVRGGHSITVGNEEHASQSDLLVYGTATTTAKKRIWLRADEGLTLICGDARLDLEPDKITLKAPSVEISPTKALVCKTKDGPLVTLGEDVEILSKKLRVFTEGGALEIDQDFKAKGSKIKLGYDPSKPEKSAEEREPETKPFALTLSDYFLDPYANKTYHLFAEGLRFEGKTDGEGKLSHDIPKSTKQVVVRLWVNEYPAGQQQVYRIEVREVPPADSVAGAKQRLKNLGFYQGRVNGVADEELEGAVRAFQKDHAESHGLEPTGELDDGTTGALEEVHGS